MKAQEMIASVRDLPPVSSAAFKLINLLGDSETGNEEAVQVIKQDMVLTAKLLRACNSSALGLAEPVTSIDQAVLLLGHQQIYRTVMAMSFRGPLDVPLQAYAMEAGDLWRHSLLAARAAEMGVAQGVDVGLDGATAFTIGLLHDIGKLVTSQFLTRHLLTCIKHEVAKGISALEAERNMLQTDHAEVGAALLCLWCLPNILVEAIGLHHSPLGGNTPGPATMAFFADRVAHQAVAFLDQRELPSSSEDQRVFEAIGFSGNKLQDFIESVVESSAETDEIIAVCC